MANAFPLQWPEGWTRTRSRSSGGFKSTIASARDAIIRELRRMGVPDFRIVISSNLPLRNDGLPIGTLRSQLSDPGVAVYFTRFEREHVIACDKYARVESNMRALAKTLAAMRGIERWGATQVMERAFRGFAALPPPARPKPWREVLGYQSFSGKPSAENIRERYHVLAAAHHPDRGGSPERMAEINRARDEAMKELGV